MSEVKISDLEDAPAEGEGRALVFDHPWTEIEYELALFHEGDRYFVITDRCALCETKLSQGERQGMYVRCVREGHPWHIKTGLCKFDRTRALPTYRVKVKDDGLYIEI